MKIKLIDICYARSGDKGENSNIGLIFKNEKLYKWGCENITEDDVKNYLKSFVKGKVVRYKLNNLASLNFILYDSLGGGGSDSLLNDAQGKTHAQFLLTMNIDIPKKIKDSLNE